MTSELLCDDVSTGLDPPRQRLLLQRLLFRAGPTTSFWKSVHCVAERIRLHHCRLFASLLILSTVHRQTVRVSTVLSAEQAVVLSNLVLLKIYVAEQGVSQNYEESLFRLRAFQDYEESLFLQKRLSSFEDRYRAVTVTIPRPRPHQSSAGCLPSDERNVDRLPETPLAPPQTLRFLVSFHQPCVSAFAGCQNIVASQRILQVLVDLLFQRPCPVHCCDFV